MTDSLTFEELIEIKRDAGTHTRGQIRDLVLGFSSGRMPDYQMSAWLMAAYLNGLDPEETVWLTEAMVDSGRVVDLSSVPGLKVDKHSTGGVADTTTLVLAPLVASCGVPVAKMSGRGLGHTGGTLDKLESIPGMRIDLSPEEFITQVREVGVAVIAQGPDIDPADKLMYALRDVTATVPSVPLIVGSIISKKIAGGADAIVLDVKVGSGAFMKTVEQARHLAGELTRVGSALGRSVECRLTDMDQPLGMAVGNAIEVAEAIETLRGHGPRELHELCMVFGARMLVLGEVAPDADAAREMLERSIASGAALAKMRAWIAAQGGDTAIVDDTSLLPVSSCSRELRATSPGWVGGFDAEGIGRAAMLTGAGRQRTDDVIDPGAGIRLAVRVGDRVEPGGLLATAYAAREELLDAASERFMASIRLGDSPVGTPPLFLDA